MYIYMYERCHLTPRRSSQLEVFLDYWQIFQRLRHNFDSTDFLFFLLLSYLSPQRYALNFFPDVVYPYFKFTSKSPAQPPLLFHCTFPSHHQLLTSPQLLQAEQVWWWQGLPFPREPKELPAVTPITGDTLALCLLESIWSLTSTHLTPRLLSYAFPLPPFPPSSFLPHIFPEHCPGPGAMLGSRTAEF